MVLEVPNNVMNSTDTCPCITDRHHERPSQDGYQPGRGSATRRQWYHLDAQLVEEGSPRRGSQSPPQSSTKPPDSAERCEWLSAAMRLTGRLAMRRRSSMVCWLAGPTVLASIPTSISQLTHLHSYHRVTIGCALLQCKAPRNCP